MSALAFTLGVVAAFLDEFGDLARRDRIYRALPDVGATTTGFDLTFQYVLNPARKAIRWMARA